MENVPACQMSVFYLHKASTLRHLIINVDVNVPHIGWGIMIRRVF